MHKGGDYSLYDLNNMANMIRLRARIQKIKLGDMLGDLELDINTISEMSKGRQVAATTLAKIADYLDCSVDYLLGRTDNPQAHRDVPREKTLDKHHEV